MIEALVSYTRPVGAVEHHIEAATLRGKIGDERPLGRIAVAAGMVEVDTMLMLTPRTPLATAAVTVVWTGGGDPRVKRWTENNLVLGYAPYSDSADMLPPDAEIGRAGATHLWYRWQLHHIISEPMEFALSLKLDVMGPPVVTGPGVYSDPYDGIPVPPDGSLRAPLPGEEVEVDINRYIFRVTGAQVTGGAS